MKFQFSIFDFKSKNEKRFDYCFSITKLKRKTKKFQFWFLFQIEQDDLAVDDFRIAKKIGRRVSLDFVKYVRIRTKRNITLK